MSRPLVVPFFLKYSVTHEGFTPFPYCDSLNLVTTGIGNLIDSSARNSFDISPAAMAPAMGLPWKFRAPGWSSKNPVAGAACSQNDIANAWITCKLQEQQFPGFNKKGGFAYAGLTSITLDMAGINTLVNNKIASNQKILIQEYPNFEALPSDAQLGIMSMAWAMGPAFYPVLKVGGKPVFQAFKDAVDRLDLESAATHSQFQGGGSATDPLSRNHDLLVMFRNAAAVVKAGADPDLLFFPGSGPTSSGGLLATIKPSFFTPSHVAGGLIAAGSLAYMFRDVWLNRKKKS